MGNIITNTSSLTTSLDLADGNAKVKKDLKGVGKSTFTGDSTFDGLINVTNGKFNNVDIPLLDGAVTKLKTDLTSLNTTIDSVKAGSFEGKAISGATDVTASGTGTFKTIKTTDIDINGDILSSSGKKYIVSNETSGLSMTNGLSDSKANANAFNLKADGNIQVTSAVGKSVMINDMIFSKTENPLSRGTYFNTLTGSGLINIENLNAKKVKTASLTVDSESTFTGQIIANGGVKASAITSTGLVTANGGISTSTLTATGDLNTKNVVIGTNKWVIEEVADANKGTRLCFGKADAQGVKTYWTCMNNTGNLEMY